MYSKAKKVVCVVMMVCLICTLVPFKANAGNSESDYVTKAIEILKDAGYTDDEIELFDDSALKDIAQAGEIISSTKYYKVDDVLGNSEEVSEEEAFLAVKENANERIENKVKFPGVFVVKSVIGNDSNTPGQFKDSYMKMTHSAITNTSYKSGKGWYRFFVSAEWLQLPAARLRDSVGSCAQNIAADRSSGSGKLMYVETKTNATTNAKVSEQTKTVNFSSSDIKLANNNGWAGVAAGFDLPITILSNGSHSPSTPYNVIPSKVRVQFEFYGRVNQYNQACSFNSIATYVHSTVGVGSSAGVSIGTGGLSGAIGINLVSSSHIRQAELVVNYRP